MRSSLTGRGFALLLVGGALLALGKVMGVPEFTAIGTAALVLIVGCVFFVARARRVLIGERHAPIRAEFGTSTSAQCSGVPFRFLEVMLTEVITIPGTKEQASAHSMGSTIAYRVPARRRGVVELGPLRARVRDPFGIAATGKVIAPMNGCIIFPKRVELGRLTAARLWRRGIRQRGEGDASTIREFQPGDELRNIHWRASARQDELMVRDGRHDNNQMLTLTVDLRATEHFEELISAAYSIAWSWLEHGSVRCVDHSGHVFLECPRGAITTLGNTFGRLEPRTTAAAPSQSDVVLTAVPAWSPPERTILFAPSASSLPWILVTGDFASAWNSDSGASTPA